MNCPHCGAAQVDRSRKCPGIVEWECGTDQLESGEAHDIGDDCRDRLISQLKAKLSQFVRRDDPRFGVIRSEIQLVQRLTQNPTFRLSLEFADKQLQSIIEGK